VRNPPLTRNCDREDPAENGHWETGKAAGEQPSSQETLVYDDPVRGQLFSKLRGRACEKPCLSIYYKFPVKVTRFQVPFLRKGVTMFFFISKRAFFFALLAAFLFAGCQPEPDEHINTHFIPVGEWDDGWDGGYNITNTTIEYYTPAFGDDYPAMNLKGTIETAMDFSHNSGVLLIKITEQTNMGLTAGKYTCVYYRDYTPSHVLLANPVDALYNSIQTDTIDLAKITFTADTVGTHVTHWGSGYTK
jgi:hypothetical protein